MKIKHFTSVILAVITLWQINFIGSQNQVYINPNSLFDLGVTTAQLAFSIEEGINDDQYELWSARIVSKYANAMHPQQVSIDVDALDLGSFSAASMLPYLKEMVEKMPCDYSYFQAIEDIYNAGFGLAHGYLVSGSNCSDCLASALIEVEAILLDLGTTFSQYEEPLGQSVVDLAGQVQQLYLNLQYSQNADLILDQNALVSEKIINMIGQLNLLFPDRFFNCIGEEKTPATEANPVCSVTEMVAISQDAHSKTFVARGEADTYSWRFRPHGAAWKYAEETDSIFMLEIDSTLTYDVQVSAWCESILDFTDYINESLVYNYAYGCYAPTYHNLTVSNIQQTSARLHVSRYSSRIQWAYREVGKTWKYYTTNKTSIHYTGLKPGYTYEFACRLWCNHGWTSWSPTKKFTSKGNGCIVYRPTVSGVTSTSAKTHSRHSGKKQWAFRKKGGHWRYYTNSYTGMKWSCQPNTTYEIALRIICHGKWSNWCTPVTWTTKGNTCHTPSSNSLKAYNISASAATTHVNASASAYNWAIRKKGGKWYYYSDNDPTYHWTGLAANTTYEFRVKIYCGGHWTYYSPTRQFTTKGYSCYSPTAADIYYSNLTSSSVKLHIKTNASTVEYALYRTGWSEWKIWRKASKSFSIVKLLSNQVYQYTMRVYCNGAWTKWAPIESFRTKVDGRSADIFEGDEMAEDRTLPTLTVAKIEMEKVNQAPMETKKKSVPVALAKSNDEIRSKDLVIFPNPATEYFQVSSDVKAESISIINMQGQIVLHVSDLDPDQRIELQSIRAGHYQVVVNDGEGNRRLRKLMVIH